MAETPPPENGIKKKLDEIHADVKDIKAGQEGYHMRADREIHERYDILIHIWTGITRMERKFVALFHREDKKNGPRD